MNQNTPPTEYQEFTRLLYDAYDASDMVDGFDVDSRNPESVVKWKQLLKQQGDAKRALVDYCLRHGRAILAQNADLNDAVG